MRKEIIYSREYFFSILSNQRPSRQEEKFWIYFQYVINLRPNYENINERLLESLVIKHKAQLKEY